MRNSKSPKQRNLLVAGKMSNLKLKANLAEQHLDLSNDNAPRLGFGQKVGSLVSKVTTMVGRGKKVRH